MTFEAVGGMLLAAMAKANPKPHKHWSLYAEHRQHLTQAILQAEGGRGGRLCLLGAGHCNDVDLSRLAGSFSEIHLVDIDPGALGQAVARQKPALRSRIFRHAPVDFSGLSPRRLRKWKRAAPPLAEVESAAAEALSSLLARLPGPFDVVASTCVLTQMSFSLRDALGRGHPMLPSIRLAMMGTHISTLIGLTADAGEALFVCDLTSSNHYPLTDLDPARDLREVMSDVVEQGSAYYAANPELIRELAARDGRVNAAEWLDPWLWTGALNRVYLVYALRLPRHE